MKYALSYEWEDWTRDVIDHSTRHRPLPTYWWYFGTKPVSPAVFEILASKSIGVKTLTFLGHVTSSVTWQFESQWVISYWWSIGPKSLSPSVFKIFGIKHIGVTTLTLTFQGHVTSWSSFDSQVVISYRCSIGTICDNVSYTTSA